MQIYEEITPAENENEAVQPVHRNRVNASSILAVQAAVCLTVLIFVLILKFVFPVLYAEFRMWLGAELQRSIWIDHAPV